MTYPIALATLFLTIIIPFVVNLCKNESWSTNTKRWMAIGVSIVAGVATGIISGIPTAESLISWTLSVIGGVQVAYAAFKAIGVTSSLLDALEGITASKKSE